MNYPSIMVDVETSGTDPSHSFIIQIAAVRFNREEQTIDHSSMFNRSLQMTTPGRFWDEDTRRWWMGQKAGLLESLMENAYPPALIMQEFNDWVYATPTDRPLHFWSKPISFDFPFIASYFKQYQIAMPFGYWLARDVNTYIAAKDHADPRAFWKTLEFEGDAHNALFDVLHQIKGVFHADR